MVVGVRIRDMRVWHGGTPKLSGHTKYLHAIMFMSRATFDWEFECTAILSVLPVVLSSTMAIRIGMSLMPHMVVAISAKW